MHVACPHCTGRMYVPDVYQDRLIKCSRCRGLFIPRTNGKQRHERAPAGVERTHAAADEHVFCGMETDHELLVQMCERAKACGNIGRYDFLSAYANAQTALWRDTWQAASFEWRNAHHLLSKLKKERAQPLVEQARCEFTRRASSQLLDLARQMARELRRETAHLPDKARRVRARKIGDSFRNLVGDDYRRLVDTSAIRQVERIAEDWEALGQTETGAV